MNVLSIDSGRFVAPRCSNERNDIRDLGITEQGAERGHHEAGGCAFHAGKCCAALCDMDKGIDTFAHDHWIACEWRKRGWVTSSICAMACGAVVDIGFGTALRGIALAQGICRGGLERPSGGVRRQGGKCQEIFGNRVQIAIGQVLCAVFDGTGHAAECGAMTISSSRKKSDDVVFIPAADPLPVDLTQTGGNPTVHCRAT